MAAGNANHWEDAGAGFAGNHSTPFECRSTRPCDNRRTFRRLRTVGMGIVSRVDQNGERLVYPLACILLYGAERQDGSSAHIERHGFEVNLTGDFAPPLDALTCPEIVPDASRKIDLARGCTLLNHRRH